MRTAKDVEGLGVELHTISSLLEILAIYFGETRTDIPDIDVVNDEITMDSLRAVATHIERISDDLSEIDLESFKAKRAAG